MKFKNDENRENFLNDKPYFENTNDYCLGNTLEEAGEVVRQLVSAVHEGDE